MILLKDFKQYNDQHTMVSTTFYIFTEEQVKDGIVVNSLPEITLEQKNKSILCINLETKEPYYLRLEETNTEEQYIKKIEILEKQVADLSFLVMQLQGGTN